MRAMCWCVLLGLAPGAGAGSAPICKYIDGEGNIHYTNVAPEKGWKKLSCGVGDETVAERIGEVARRPPRVSRGSTPIRSAGATTCAARC